MRQSKSNASKWTVSIIIFILLLSSVILPKLAFGATANQTVNVDTSVVRGPVTYRGAGYLGADIGNTGPSDSVFNAKWAPIKLKLFSWIPPQSSGGTYNFPGLNRAIQLDAYYQIKIRGNPGDLTDGINSNWGIKTRDIARAALATGYSRIQLDILNEPDWSGYWPFTGNINDPMILEAWRVAHDAAKAVSPNIVLVGPNVGAGSINWLKQTFLPTMKAEGRLPDVLSWHEINTSIGGIANRVTDMKSYLAVNGMNVPNISINEYNYTNSFLQPGFSVQFLSQLEKAGVQSASRACWEEVSGGSYDCAPHINGLLDSSGNPRSNWWTYKAYADMTGNIVQSVDPVGFASIASNDSAIGVYSALVGSIGSENLLAVRFTNLPQATYVVKIERIPNSDRNSLSGPIFVSQIDMVPTSGVIEAVVPSVLSQQAYVVKLTRTGNVLPTTIPGSPVATPNTKPGDANGDNLVDEVDYNFWLSNYNQSLTGPSNGDFNSSGFVDGVDYTIWLRGYGN